MPVAESMLGVPKTPPPVLTLACTAPVLALSLYTCPGITGASAWDEVATYTLPPKARTEAHMNVSPPTATMLVRQMIAPVLALTANAATCPPPTASLPPSATHSTGVPPIAPNAGVLASPATFGLHLPHVVNPSARVHRVACVAREVACRLPSQEPQ